jgi:hypothetical protein
MEIGIISTIFLVGCVECIGGSRGISELPSLLSGQEMLEQVLQIKKGVDGSHPNWCGLV